MVVLLLLAGCSARKSAPAGRPWKDPAGRMIRLPVEVHRIVSLAPSMTEILCAVGGCGLLVGVDRYSNYPPEVAKVPRVGADIDPSIEKILSLKPDLVLAASTANAEATLTSLERAGVPVVGCLDQRIDDVYTDLVGVAEAIGHRAEGERAAATLQAQLASVRALPGDAGVGARVLVVVWPDPLVVAGRTSLVAELIRWVGGVNIADDSSRPFPTYSQERMLESAPEVLIVGTHADGAPPLEGLKKLSIPAARNHRIHLVDGDILFRPGPRLGEAATILARLVHR